MEQAAFPTPAADGVDHGEVAVHGTFEQKGPQNDGAADVVGDHAGFAESPVIEQLDESACLRGQGEILALALVGLPVAEVVEHEDRSLAAQVPVRCRAR